MGTIKRKRAAVEVVAAFEIQRHDDLYGNCAHIRHVVIYTAAETVVHKYRVNAEALKTQKQAAEKMYT